MENRDNKLLKNVLKKAKSQTAMKDVSSFAFSRFFGVLLALLAPFFKHKKQG